MIQLLLCFLLATSVYSFSDPRVLTDAGEIEGRLHTSHLGNEGYAFQGIPYAEPPLRNLRFQPPLPKRPWSGVLKTKNYGPACWQNETISDYFPDLIDEDCLYLNVFTPIKKPSSQDIAKKPGYAVIYYVHGGGWEFDTPRMFPVDEFIDNFVANDVIIVTVGYRLGAFGFWTTGTAEASGNTALKDIILGLHWVQRNIARFGGNPKKVTLQGHSSAGMGVNQLTLSPLTEGLFHQAVPMSGNTFTDDVIRNDLTLYQNVSNVLGCNQKCLSQRSCTELTLCMQELDPWSLTNTYKYFSSRHGPLPSQPRIDGPGGVLPLPVEKLAVNRRPMTYLTGNVLNEQPVFSRSSPAPTRGEIKTLCDHFAKSDTVAAACLFHYDVEIRQESKATFFHQPLKDIYSAKAFLAGQFRDADFMRRAGADVYLYSFDYVEQSLLEDAPYHSLDLTYLFGIHPFNLTQDDLKMRKLYGQIFSNFAKFGKPWPTWEKLRTPIGFNYFSVNLKPENRDFFHVNDVQFWNRIVPYLERFNPGSQSELRNNIQASAAKMKPFFRNNVYYSSRTWPMQNLNAVNLQSVAVNPTAKAEKTANPYLVQNGVAIQYIVLTAIAAVLGFIVSVLLAYRRKPGTIGKGSRKKTLSTLLEVSDEHTPLLSSSEGSR